MASTYETHGSFLLGVVESQIFGGCCEEPHQYAVWTTGLHLQERHTGGDVDRFDGLQGSLCLLQRWASRLQLSLRLHFVHLGAREVEQHQSSASLLQK